MSLEDKNYIDELKKSLYSRTVPDIQTRRKLKIEDENDSIQRDWPQSPKREDLQVELNTEYKNSNRMSFFTKFFIGSLVFCIVVVSIGAYLFFKGSNLISADNISIDISGPVSIPGGEPVSFDIISKNNNKIDLEDVTLNVDFPDGSTDPNNPNIPLKRYSKDIGAMPVGGVYKDTVNAIIFGEENLQKSLNVTLTYNVKGSTSIFTKTKSYDVLVNSSPIKVNITTLKEVTSGQEFDTRVEISSNSKESLKGVLFEATYPFGFNYISSTINPVSSNNVWNIGDLPTGAKRVFSIKGSLTGEDTDLRSFHFNIGSKGNNPVKIGTQYLSIDKEITIQKPFVSLAIEVNGNSGFTDSVGQFDRNSTVNIKWFNNLSTIVTNMKIVAKIEGTAYEKSTVSPNGGYFNSSDNTITWSAQTNKEFASVGPGDNGMVTLSIIPKDFSQAGKIINNPKITITASVSGDRTQETNVPLTVSASTKRNIIIPSAVDLSARIVRNVGPFSNSGFIPPKVDNVSTYTIILSVSNTTNPVRDVEVTATLPPYVKWLEQVSPNSETVNYDQNSGLVTWSVGNIEANRDTLSRKEVAFQVAFTPNIIQVGSAPALINQIKLSGTDNFTNTAVTSNKDSLTTRFSTDPSYKPGDEVVSK